MHILFNFVFSRCTVDVIISTGGVAIRWNIITHCVLAMFFSGHISILVGVCYNNVLQCIPFCGNVLNNPWREDEMKIKTSEFLLVTIFNRLSGSHRGQISLISMILCECDGLIPEQHFRYIFLQSQLRYHGNRDHVKMAKSGQYFIYKPLKLRNLSFGTHFRFKDSVVNNNKWLSSDDAESGIIV